MSISAVPPTSTLGPTTSAQLASALTDETGTGAVVLANTPTLVTPILGTPTSGTLTNCTGLPMTGLTDARAQMAALMASDFGGANVTESFPRHQVRNDGGKTMTSGTLYLTRVPVFTGQTITNISYCTHATALASITGYWFALFESASAGTPYDFIAQTADTSSAWAASTTKTLALSSPHVVTSAQGAIGYLYAGICVRASTMGTYWAWESMEGTNISFTPKLGGTSSTGLGATAPDPATAPTGIYYTIYARFS